MKYVIVGGVASGATAAARIRRIDEFAQILILEKGKHISYANCALPYYLGGVITEREQLFLQTPASFSARFKVEVRVENEVVELNPTRKTLTVRKANGSEYQESYDKLLLSPGATAFIPQIKGIHLEGIFPMRTVEDIDKVKNHCLAHEVKKAVILGGGANGLEIAENLHHLGIDVSIVEKGNHVISRIDFVIAAHIQQHLLQKGVHLYLGQNVESFERQGNQLKVHLNSGQALTADMVILAAGTRPQTSLAQKAGLKIGETGGLCVDTYLQTSEADIYAAGDVIEFPHPLTGKPTLSYLGGPANRQARIVADNMALGNSFPYEGYIGTAIAKTFDIVVGTTGVLAKDLKATGIPHQTCIIHEASHASYYPGASPLCIQLAFHPDNGTLYGAQCVGLQGVDKRIDRLALVIQQRGTVKDLTRLEHAYSPIFSSARDPIAIAGYVGSNIVHKAMSPFTWDEVAKLNLQESVLLDVRTPAEFEAGHIEGATLIPVDELRSRLKELPQNKTIYVYCAVGRRGYLATLILKAHGYRAKNLSGGYTTYFACYNSKPPEDKKSV